MPAQDGTGPYGTGPVGRGVGPCGGGYVSRRSSRWGRGFWRGRGPGRRWFWSAPTPEDEVDFMEQEKSWLKTQLEVIEKRLENLNKPTS